MLSAFPFTRPDAQDRRSLVARLVDLLQLDETAFHAAYPEADLAGAVPTGVCRSNGVDLAQTGGEQLAAALKAASLRTAWIWQVMIGTEREDGTFEQHPITPKDGTECAVWRIGLIDQLSRTSLLADMAAAAGGKCDEDPAA